MMDSDSFDYYKNLLSDAKNLYGMMKTIFDLDVFGLDPNDDFEDAEYQAKCLWVALMVMSGEVEGKMRSIEATDMPFLKGVASSICDEITAEKKIDRYDIN
jgi:hypothetical protein